MFFLNVLFERCEWCFCACGSCMILLYLATQVMELLRFAAGRYHLRSLCVWTIWRDVKLLLLQFPNFRGRGTIHVLWAMVQRSGHSTCGYHGWSPWRTCFFMSNPRTTMPFSNNLFSTCPGGNDLVRWNIASSSGLEILSSWSFSDLFINLFLSGITGLFFARRMHSTSEFAEIVLSKCVIHAGFVTVAWTPRGMLV